MHLRPALAQLEAAIFDLLTAIVVLPFVILPTLLAAAVDLSARAVRWIRALSGESGRPR